MSLDGRLVNIDFRADSDFGPPHKIPRDEFVRQARKDGYEVADEKKFLQQQYFIILNRLR